MILKDIKIFFYHKEFIKITKNEKENNKNEAKGNINENTI